MATRVIGVKMQMDAGQSVEELNKVEQGLKNVDKATNKLGADQGVKSFDDQLKALNQKVQSGTLDARQLSKAIKDYQTIALNAGRTSPIGQKALQEAAVLRDKITDLDTEIKNLSNDSVNLQAAMQLGGGIVAGFTAFKGVTAALGIESENLQKTMVQLQGAQSVLMSMDRLHLMLRKESFVVIKAQALATKILSAAQKAYAVTVGTSTGALKLFRLALAATGIGAIIVALGFLITNFDLVQEKVKQAIKWLMNLNDWVLILLGPIGLLILAYKKLWGDQETAADRAKQRELERAKAEEEAHRARIRQLEEEAKAQEKVIEEIEKKGKIQKEVDDLAILQLKAKGASESEVFELQKQQNEARLEQAKKEMEAKLELIRINHEMAEAEYNRLRTLLETQAIANGWTEEQVQKDLQRLEDAKARYLEDEQNKIEALERGVATLEAENEIFIRSRNEQNKKGNDEAEKERERHAKEMQKIAEKDHQERLKQADKLFNDRKKITDRLLEYEMNATKDEFQIRMDELQRQHEEELALFTENQLETNNLRLRLEQEFQDKMDAIQEEADKADEELENQKFEGRLAKAQQHLDNIQVFLDTASAINDLLNQIGENRKADIEKERDDDLKSLDKQKKAELSRENLSAREKAKIEARFAMQEFEIKKKAAEAQDKIAKRQFMREKALRISQAVIDTASAVIKSLAAYGATPFGIAASVAAGVTGAAQIATIAAQRFEGTAGSIEPPDISIPDDVGSDGSDAGATIGGDQENQGTATEGLLQPKLEVSIVEIENVASKVNEIDAISTI